jgi:hypothetical protein
VQKGPENLHSGSLSRILSIRNALSDTQNKLNGKPGPNELNSPALPIAATSSIFTVLFSR